MFFSSDELFILYVKFVAFLIKPLNLSKVCITKEEVRGENLFQLQYNYKKRLGADVVRVFLLAVHKNVRKNGRYTSQKRLYSVTKSFFHAFSESMAVSQVLGQN